MSHRRVHTETNKTSLPTPAFSLRSHLLQRNPDENDRETIQEKSYGCSGQASTLPLIGHSFGQVSAQDSSVSRIQPKLTIGEPNDQYEQEADQVADQVMRMPAPKIQRLCPECKDEVQRQPMAEEEKEEETLQTKPLAESITPLIQRQMEPTEEEKKKREEETLQTKPASGEASTVSPTLQNQITALQGSGQPLPESERHFFEPRFGADFSQVRLHADGRAAEAARAVNARAFTLGRDVVFGAGEYQPRSTEGQRLLAHELTHVVQQESGVRRVDTPVQRSATSEILQRQPTPPAKPEIKFRIGWFTDDGSPVETNGQVAALARLAVASLQDNIGDVSSDTVKTQVTDWIAWAKWALPHFDKHAGEKVDPSFIPSINRHYDALLEVQEAVRVDKVIQIKEALWREHDAAVKAAEEAEALQPALDDALRAAYRKGSSSTVKEVVSTVKGAISIGRSIRTLAADITKDIMGLPLASGTKIYVDHWTSQIGRPKITIINVGKYTEMLGKLGRGLSALNIVLTIADRSKKATEAEQGMKDLSDAVNIGTDLVTVSGLSAPPHFSLYTTLYLKPALKVISKQIGVLVENLSDVNRTAVEVTGDLMYPNAEPGGQEMFDLMIKVMHADDESGFPALPSGVKQYLFDHREKLSIGAEAHVPTEGSWFWKELDGAAGRRWLFANRKRVWAMFYGSMKVPNGKH